MQGGQAGQRPQVREALRRAGELIVPRNTVVTRTRRPHPQSKNAQPGQVAQFLRKLVEATAKMRLGPGLVEESQMGPLVSKEQERFVLGFIEEGTRAGATLLAGGRKSEAEELRAGNFILPTIFTDVAADMRIAREEIFGPVLCAFDFEKEDDLIAAANRTQYGLAAGVWTQGLPTAHRVARRLEAGMVSINEFPVTFPQTPFSGFKESALGHEQGLDAVDSYTRIKSVMINFE